MKIETTDSKGQVDVSWECACPQHPEDHRPTIGRAWCYACSEWCYPHALCVRGEHEVYRVALEQIEEKANRGIAIYEEHGGPVSLGEPLFDVRTIAHSALAP